MVAFCSHLHLHYPRPHLALLHLLSVCYLSNLHILILFVIPPPSSLLRTDPFHLLALGLLIGAVAYTLTTDEISCHGFE